MWRRRHRSARVQLEPLVLRFFACFFAQIELCAQHSDGSCSPSLLSVSARLQADLFPGALVYFGSDVKTGERFL